MRARPETKRDIAVCLAAALVCIAILGLVYATSETPSSCSLTSFEIQRLQETGGSGLRPESVLTAEQFQERCGEPVFEEGGSKPSWRLCE